MSCPNFPVTAPTNQYWTSIALLRSSPACAGTECPSARGAQWDSFTSLTTSPGYGVAIGEDFKCVYMVPDLEDVNGVKVLGQSGSNCADTRGIVCSGSCDTCKYIPIHYQHYNQI